MPREVNRLSNATVSSEGLYSRIPRTTTADIPLIQRFQKLGIRQVLRASRRPLVSNQVFARDHPDGRIVDHRGHAPAPRVRELDPIKSREEINAIRCTAQLDHPALGLES